MELFNSALGRNVTFVRPAFFVIKGFVGIPNIKYYYILLLFVYIFSLLGNTVVMTVIIYDHSLRTPKYIAVFNVAFVDVFGNTAVVPKMMDLFLSKHSYISYNECLAFLFFCFISNVMQSLNLVALAYDRLIAIIFPLHYPVKVSHRFMLSLIGFFWLLAITLVLIVACFLMRLSFCKSVVINSYFCDHGPLYRLGCNDVTPNRILAGVLSHALLTVPLCFILATYCAIAYALVKVATVKERLRAFKTCTSHLSLVALFYLPIIFVYRFGRAIHPNARIISLSLTVIFPPMLNPIVYVLQTQEIKNSLRKLLKIRGVSKISAIHSLS